MIDVPVSTSKVHMQEMILPNDSNILGNVESVLVVVHASSHLVSTVVF